MVLRLTNSMNSLNVEAVARVLDLNFFFHSTIRLWAPDFNEVIVEEAEGRINYRLIEIERE